MSHGHCFHFDHQTKLKLVRTIPRRDHLADMSLTDIWVPIVIAWSKNGRFMIAFDRKQKLPTNNCYAIGNKHHPTGSCSLDNSFHGPIHELAAAEAPVNNYQRVNASGGISNRPRSNTPRSSFQRNKACKLFNKLFRPDHHKSTATMAGTRPEPSFPELEGDFGNFFQDSQVCAELDDSGGFHELPVQPHELVDPHSQPICELPLSGDTNILGQQSYLCPPQEINSSEIFPPSHNTLPDFDVDPYNGLGMEAAHTSHEASMPLQQITLPWMETAAANFPPHAMLGRGQPLSLNVTPPHLCSPPLLQQYSQFSPDPSESTPGSDQSARSALFSPSSLQSSVTVATSVLSNGSDSTYPNATTPSDIAFLDQRLPPPTQAHAVLEQAISDENLPCFEHGHPTVHYPVKQTQNSNTGRPTQKKSCVCGKAFTGTRHDINCNMKRHRKYSCIRKFREKLRCGWDGCMKVYARPDGLRTHRAKIHDPFLVHGRTISGSFASF